MKFTQKDQQFVKSITQSLTDRFTINVNDDIGTSYLSPTPFDRVFPSVRVSSEEIKEMTERKKLRQVVVDELVNSFNKNSFLSAKKDKFNNLTVEVIPEKEIGLTKFKSLKDLNDSNYQTIKKYENDRVESEDTIDPLSTDW